MAVVVATGTPAGAINYTHITDTSADFTSVANSTYFYNKADKLVRFKDATGAVLEIFSAAGGGGGGTATGLQTPVFGSLFSLPTNAATNCTSAGSFNSSNPNQVTYYPYIPNVSFTCVQFAITVNSPQVGGLAKICVYSSVSGGPGNLLYNSVDLDCSTTGNKTVVSSFVFTQGTIYWLAIHSNLNPITFAGISNSAVLQVGNLSGNPITCWLQVSATYSSGPPSSAAPNSFQTSGVPSIFMSK